MNVRIFSTPERASQAVARLIVDAINLEPSLVLGVAAGRTPVGVYEALVNAFEAGRADFSRVTIFSLDEFLGVTRRDPGSFHAFLSRHFFSRVNLRPSAIHSLDGAARDPARECDRYERKLARSRGVDLQLLGLGSNGHIAFNEPGEWLQVRSHRIRLRPETRRANADLFGGDPAAVPFEGLTMGMGAILSARRIILLATGQSKAAVVAHAFTGRCTTKVPASLLQLHTNVDVVLDAKAAGRLGRPG